MEILPITITTWHLAVHLLFLRIRLFQAFREGLCILPSRWKTRPEQSPTNFTGAKPGGSGIVSKRLPRYADMSRSASVWKSPPCAETKSRARRLLCAVKCVIGSKWRGEGGADQVRRRHGGRSEAPVDDVRRCSKKASGAKPSDQHPGPREEFTFECFMSTSKRRSCGISPHIMPERGS
jgi:hypothetical protein